MKNSILALLGFFAFTTAFACSSAPPEPVRLEIKLCETYKYAPEYVYAVDVAQVLVLPCVDQMTLFNSAPAVTIDRPGFVYRNVDYENLIICSNTTINMKKSKNSGLDRLKYRDPDREKINDLVPRCFS